MLKKLQNILLVMTFIPLIGMTTLGLNIVPEIDLSFNNALTTKEIRDSIDIERMEKALKINTYFYERSMPLTGYGMQFVLVAEKYGIPYNLLPAIAIRESSGGKRLLNNNPFGWGSALIKFDDFNHAIEIVGKNLGGANPKTASYYAYKDIKKKLYYYNGTIIKNYEDQVIDIMNKIDKTEIAEDTVSIYKNNL